MLTHEPEPELRDAEVIEVAILEDGRYDRLGMLTEIDAEPNMVVVSATADPHAFLERIRKAPPDVAVVDLRIYDDDTAGMTVIQEIKGSHPQVKVIVLTAFPVPSVFLSALRIGVEAFAKKLAGDDRPTLGQLARWVVEGARYYDPDLLLGMHEHVAHADPSEASSKTEAAPVRLTPRELQVLDAMMRGLSEAQIAAELHISRHTAKAHMRSIRSKLHAKSRGEAILTAVALGILNRHE